MTDRGIEYGFEAEHAGWSLVLKVKEVPGAKYYLNGKPVALSPAGIRMLGRKNRLLQVPPAVTMIVR